MSHPICKKSTIETASKNNCAPYQIFLLLIRLSIEQSRLLEGMHMGFPIGILKTERHQANITTADVHKLTPCVHLHTLGGDDHFSV